MASSSSNNTLENLHAELVECAGQKRRVLFESIIEKYICLSLNIPAPEDSLNDIFPDDGFASKSFQVLSTGESEQVDPRCIAVLRQENNLRRKRCDKIYRKVLKSRKHREQMGLQLEELVLQQQVNDKDDDDNISVDRLYNLTEDDTSGLALSVNIASKSLQCQLNNGRPMTAESNASMLGLSLDRVDKEPCYSLHKNTSKSKSDNVHKKIKVNNSWLCTSLAPLIPVQCQIISDEHVVNRISDNFVSCETVSNRSCLLGDVVSIKSDKSNEKTYNSTGDDSDDKTRSSHPSAVLNDSRHCPSKRGSLLRSCPLEPLTGTIRRKHSIRILNLSKRVTTAQATNTKMPPCTGSASKYSQHIDKNVSTKNINCSTDREVPLNSKYHLINPSLSKTLRSGKCYDVCDNKAEEVGDHQQRKSLLQNVSSPKISKRKQREPVLSKGSKSKDRILPFPVKLTELSFGNCQTKNASSAQLSLSRQQLSTVQSKRSYLILYKDGSHGIFPNMSSSRHFRPPYASAGPGHVCPITSEPTVSTNYTKLNFEMCVANSKFIKPLETGSSDTKKKTATLLVEEIFVPNFSTIPEESVNSPIINDCQPEFTGGVEGDGGPGHLSSATFDHVQFTRKFSRLQSRRNNLLSIEYQNKHRNTDGLPKQVQASSPSTSIANDLSCSKNECEPAAEGIPINSTVSREEESPRSDAQPITTMSSYSSDHFALSKFTSPNDQGSFRGFSVIDHRESNNLSLKVSENDEKVTSLKFSLDSNKLENRSSGTKRRSRNADTQPSAIISHEEGEPHSYQLRKRLGLGMTVAGGLSPRKNSTEKDKPTNSDENNFTSNSDQPPSSESTSLEINENNFTNNSDQPPSSESTSLETNENTLTNNSDQPPLSESTSLETKVIGASSINADESSHTPLAVTRKILSTRFDSPCFNNTDIGSSNQTTNNFSNSVRKSFNFFGDENSDPDSDDGDVELGPVPPPVCKKKLKKDRVSIKSLCAKPFFSDRESVKLMLSMQIED